LPSLHAVPLAAAGLLHAPLPGSHVPATWQASCATHVVAVPAWHEPAWQASPTVHALPSLQVVPLVASGFERAPVDGLHVPATWH
jgi:hypothetical protein